MITAIGIAWCFALYFPVALPIGNNFFIPNFPGLLLAAMHLNRGPNVVQVVQITGIALLYAVLNAVSGDLSVADLATRLKSAGQLPYTLMCCSLIGFSKSYTGLERNKLFKIFGLFTGIIVLIALVEPYTIVQQISDKFRLEFYRDLTLYDFDQRDLEIAGKIRPKAFTPEPSHAAWAIVCLSTLMVFLGKSKLTKMWVTIQVGIAAYAFASPACVLGSLLFAGMQLINSADIEDHQGSQNLNRIPIPFLGAAIITVLSLLYLATTILRNRYQDIDGLLSEGSTYIRIFQPFDLAIEGIVYNPLLGVGFSGLESIWTKMGLIDGEAVSNLSSSIGAAILTVPLFGGILGTVLFVALIIYLVKLTRSKSAIAYILVILFMLSQKANISNTTGWFVIFGFLNLIRKQVIEAPVTIPIVSTSSARQKQKRS
jgi:hypothetical protein